MVSVDGAGAVAAAGSLAGSEAEPAVGLTGSEGVDTADVAGADDDEGSDAGVGEAAGADGAAEVTPVEAGVATDDGDVVPEEEDDGSGSVPTAPRMDLLAARASSSWT